MKKKNNKCHPDCIYFPDNYSDIIEEKINQFGIKERSAIYLCNYDDHRITGWEECEYYKNSKEVK